MKDFFTQSHFPFKQRSWQISMDSGAKHLRSFQVTKQRPSASGGIDERAREARGGHWLGGSQ